MPFYKHFQIYFMYIKKRHLYVIFQKFIKITNSFVTPTLWLFFIMHKFTNILIFLYIFYQSQSFGLYWVILIQSPFKLMADVLINYLLYFFAALTFIRVFPSLILKVANRIRIKNWKYYTIFLIWRRDLVWGGKHLIPSEAFHIFYKNQMSFTPEQTSKQNIRQQKSSGYNEQSIEQEENTKNLTSNKESSLPNKQIRKQERGQKRKRGRRPKDQKIAQSTKKPQTREYLNELQQRKVENIAAYENALKKLRASYKQFYSPFEEQKLKLDKKAVIQVLSDAIKKVEQRTLQLRSAIRSVGVRHERNLFKYGVKEQLGYIIEYLQTGKVPKEMKYQFRELMEKDFSNIRETEMHPTLI